MNGLARICFLFRCWRSTESPSLENAWEDESRLVGGAACCAPTTEKPKHGSGFGEDAFVIGFVGGGDVVGAEFFLGVDAGGFAHLAAAVGAPGVRSVMKEVNPCAPRLAAKPPAGRARQSVVQVRRFGWHGGMC